MSSNSSQDAPRVLLSGARGFLARALAPALEARGAQVMRLTRGAPGAGALHWDPGAGRLDLRGVAPIAAAVNLAGATIAGLWTPGHRRAIRESRVSATRLLAEALATLEPRPRVLLSMSAVGFYGDRGDEPVGEASPPGRGFLAGVVEAWERAADPARRAGIRVVHPRLGLVLAAHGGVLPVIARPFRIGLGAVLGSGRQWWSWIALADALSGFLRMLDDASLEGPVNLASPRPVPQADFTRCLSQALQRPAWFRVPAFALRLAMGDFAEETLLGGARVVPARLEAAGFRFAHPELGPFLERELGRRRSA